MPVKKIPSNCLATVEASEDIEKNDLIWIMEVKGKLIAKKTN